MNIIAKILLIFCCLCQPIAVVPKPQGNTCVTRQCIISLALLYVFLIIIMHVGFHGPVSSQNVLYNGMLLPEFCFAVIRKESLDRHDFWGNFKSWLIWNIVEFYFLLSIKIGESLHSQQTYFQHDGLFLHFLFLFNCRMSSFNHERIVTLWFHWEETSGTKQKSREVSGKMLTKRPFRVDNILKRSLHTVNIHF